MRPNVIFVIDDQHRFDFVSYENNGVTFTPNLERLAAGGVAFRRAYCPSPLCCPARAAIHSGRHGQNSGCFTNLHELPPGTPSFAHQFRQAGYRTVALGKTHMEIHAYDSDLTGEKHRRYMDSLGWDEISEDVGGSMMKAGIRCSYGDFLRSRGRFEDVVKFFQQWVYFMDANRKPDLPFTMREFPFEEDIHETTYIGAKAVSWIERHDAAVPFLMHVGFISPHSPESPLPKFMDLYRSRPEPKPVGWDDCPEPILQGRRAYRAEITHIDHWLGRIMDALSARGLLENTIIVFTSDHGEMAGDHRLFDKTSFYDASARVPLVIAGPGVTARGRSEALVETIDAGKTLCELCDVPPHDLDQGVSLAALLRGQTQSHRQNVYVEMGCDRMIFDGRHKLMWGEPSADTRKLGRLHLNKPVNIPPSPPRLFDLHEDPNELHNLAAEPSAKGLLCEMLAKLLVRTNANQQTQPFKSRGEYKPLVV